QVEGVVKSLGIMDGRALIDLETSAGALTCVLPGFLTVDTLPGYLRGMHVKVSGVLGVERFRIPAETRQLYVPSVASIVIDPGQLTDLFNLPAQAHSGFFVPRNASAPERALFSGKVAVSIPGRGFFLAIPEAEGWESSAWVQALAPRD